MTWSPLQRRALDALGFTLVEARAVPSRAGAPLRQVELPVRLRSGLERWVGGLWAEWPAPAGQPRDAAFKRALWRRVRDWRRGG